MILDLDFKGTPLFDV